MKFIAASILLFALFSGGQSKTVGLFDFDHGEKQVRATLNDCGGAGATVKFNQVTLTPDPVIYPGSIGLNVDFTATAEIQHGTIVDMKMTKLGLFPISLPCIGGLGACPFDICQSVVEDQETFCQLLPTDENGACSCPAPPGNYVGPVSMALPDMGSIINSMIYGNYEGKITVLAPGGAQMGCLDMRLTISRP